MCFYFEGDYILLEYFVIAICVILVLVGFIGCVFPIIPGPPLTFLGLVLLYFASPDKYSISGFEIFIFGFFAAVGTVIDTILPLLGAKYCGVSKYGIWGCLIGMLLFMFIAPPFGIVFGILIGAIAGELYAGKSKSKALKAGVVTFIFNILAIFLKLLICVLIAFRMMMLFLN